MPGRPHRLLGWLNEPRAGRGVRFAQDDGTWRYIAYAELAERARRLAAGLRDRGVRTGDRVAVIMATGPDLVAAIFAIWYAGAVVTVVVPRSFEPEREYSAHIAAILATAAPVLVLCEPADRELIATAVPGTPVLAHGECHGAQAEAEHQPADLGHRAYRGNGSAGGGQRSGDGIRPGADLALLQFTSGSTTTPKGVRVTWDNLTDNLRRIERAIDWHDGHAMASWLPLHHDMGFIGCLLFPVSAQGDLWLLRPEQFIRDPARWLECFHRGRATHSAAPSFAFGYAARRVAPRRLAELDLSGWHSVIVGAERVDAEALARFAALTTAAGFRPRSFQPAYGLAENTLLVCANPVHEPVRLARPDWSRMTFGQPVPIMETAEFGPVSGPALGATEPGAGWLAGHGRAGELYIIDDDGAPLPDGWLGEIVVRGASVAAGYDGLDSPRFSAGELHTADAGFLLDGHLYVLGRMGDSIKVSGRSVYMEDLDAKVAVATGLSAARLCVVGSTQAARTGLAVFAEAKPGPWQDAARAFLRAELGTGLDIQVVTGTRGLIKRTSSGKPRRRHMWQTLRS